MYYKTFYLLWRRWRIDARLINEPKRDLFHFVITEQPSWIHKTVALLWPDRTFYYNILYNIIVLNRPRCYIISGGDCYETG